MLLGGAHRDRRLAEFNPAPQAYSIELVQKEYQARGEER